MNIQTAFAKLPRLQLNTFQIQKIQAIETRFTFHQIPMDSCVFSRSEDFFYYRAFILKDENKGINYDCLKGHILDILKFSILKYLHVYCLLF